MEIESRTDPATGARAVIYVFGDYELDTEGFELRRAGTRVPVEPQVLDVLAYLIASRGRLVTRDALLTQVWGHAYVSDATLSSRLMSARRAIGDSGREQASSEPFGGAVTSSSEP